MFDMMDAIGISPIEIENQMLEQFGDEFLENAMSIVQTGRFTSLDAPAIHQAMCIVVSMYIRKIKNGEINQDKVWH